MRQERTSRRESRVSEHTSHTHPARRPVDGTESTIQALQALSVAYDRVARILQEKISRSESGIDAVSTLWMRLGWVYDRQELMRTILNAEPTLMSYVSADWDQLDHIQSLAETAKALAEDGPSYPTALNLLGYIDRELGWAPCAVTAKESL